MNLVDSSGWLAFFADTKNAIKFSKPLLETAHLLVPTIVMYEVCKVMLREKDEEAALFAQAHMQQGIVVPLTPQLAANAARESIDIRMPMAGQHYSRDRTPLQCPDLDAGRTL